MFWLRNLAPNPKNSLAFVGYQAENTLGRKIQRGYYKDEIPMEEGGRTVAISLKMEVRTIEGLSGHSDYKQLLNFIGKMNNEPERIIVNHGDPVKCVEFAKAAHRIFKVETIAPKLLETIRLK